MSGANHGIEAERRWHTRDAWAVGAIAGAIVLGGLLRAAMARGDLWLDEVWSLDLVRPLASAPEVFYGISHDNNHFLNSLWLFSLGPDRAPWIYRMPAVLLGTLSVPLAAAVEWPRSRAGAVAAALLAACALPLVVYGSEARGYAGLIAATLVAVAAFERAVASARGSGTADRRASWVLGAAIGAGALCHLTMIATLAVLGVAALIRFAFDRSWTAAWNATLSLFRPALMCLVPVALAVAAGIAHRGGLTLGNVAPGSGATLAAGYGDALRTTFGWPPTAPPVLGFASAALLVCAILRARRTPTLRRGALVAATVLLPAAMGLAHLPNLAMARYYLVPAVFLLLGLAQVAGMLWDEGTPRTRAAALSLVGAIVLGQAVADREALAVGRGRYGDALASMADAAGRVRYTTASRFQVEMVASEAARARGLTASFVSGPGTCSQAPDWYVDVPETMTDHPAATLDAGSAECRVRFALARVVRTNPLSGMPWAIYRRSTIRAAD